MTHIVLLVNISAVAESFEVKYFGRVVTVTLLCESWPCVVAAACLLTSYVFSYRLTYQIDVLLSHTEFYLFIYFYKFICLLVLCYLFVHIISQQLNKVDAVDRSKWRKSI